MLKINKGMAQMCLRWFIEGTDYNMVHQSQRIHSEDLAYLSTISPERLEALDMLPVSLFRVNYRSLDAKDTGCGKLESEAFRETVYRISMLTEIQNFALRHQLHPLVAIGFDEDGYSRFSNADFLQRQAYVYRGEFTIQSRVRIKKLNLDPTDKIALLQDTCAILLAEFRYLKANKPEHLGPVADFNRGLMSLDEIADQMLKAQIQPKLVAAHTGHNEQWIDGKKRAKVRSGKIYNSKSGRIRSAERTIAEQPFHALLYLACYLLLAADGEKTLNARAVIKAHEEYCKLCSNLGIAYDDLLLASNAFRLSNAIKTQEARLMECSHCKQLDVQTIVSPHKCSWCGS